MRLKTEQINADSQDDAMNMPAMKASINDGKSHAVMMGCGESYFGVFSIFIKATTLQVGLIATLPQLLGAIIQWAGAINLDRIRSRRRVVMSGALIQALTFVPIAVLPFLYVKGYHSVTLLLVFVIVYQGANGAVVPASKTSVGSTM